MQIHQFVAAAAVAVALATTPALAQDKAKNQAEVRAKAQATLNDFYKADPKVKGEVEKSAGYAVFTTYGLSFLIGGAGGKGLAHDNKTKKVVYMDLAQASAGLQIGASDTRYLFIFKDATELQRFIDSGWEASAAAAAGAGAGSTGSASASTGGATGAKYYQLTKAGLQAGAAVAGTKVWKDKELN
jgi:lipid-binding SYLF domain-containing protein